MSLWSDLCFVSVTEAVYAKPCFSGPRNNDIRLYYRIHINIRTNETAVLPKYGILSLTQMRWNDLLHLFRVSLFKSLLLMLQYWRNRWKLLVPARCSDKMIHDLMNSVISGIYISKLVPFVRGSYKFNTIEKMDALQRDSIPMFCNFHNRKPARFYRRFSFFPNINWHHDDVMTWISYTLGREYRVMRNRYSRLLFTSEDRLCANLRVQGQSTNMTLQC